MLLPALSTVLYLGPYFAQKLSTFHKYIFSQKPLYFLHLFWNTEDWKIERRGVWFARKKIVDVFP